MKPKAHKKMKLRIGLVLFGFMVFFVVLAAKAVHLQVYLRPWLISEAKDTYSRSKVEKPKRGSILDTRNEVMALTLEGYAIGVRPGKVENRDETARVLAKALDVNRKSLARKLKNTDKFFWVRRQVTADKAESVRRLKLKGIVSDPEPIRYYPHRSLASQVLGFTSIDSKGLEGVEFYYNRSLEGEVDRSKFLIDAKGRVFDSEVIGNPAYTGNSVVLTLDKQIQFFTESALENAVTEFGAKSGMALVMAPDSGAILALAHYPFFDPNRSQKKLRERWRNRAITDPFEPGSTLKMFTAAAALESKTGSSKSIFFCENGSYRIGRIAIHDTHEYGWLSVQQIVKYSSNIGSAKMVQRMGRKTFYNILSNFGFGSKTRVDLPGETAGQLRPWRNWKPIDAANIGFGQGVSVSALQLVTATSAIANGGLLMRPHVVKAIIGPHGRVIKKTEPQVVRRVLSRENAATMRRILHTVTTEGGTGTKAALEGYGVCGKTGTAQKIDSDGRYSRKKFVSSFIGFTPVENPRLTILVVLDEPIKKHYGGTVAAPAFRKISLETLNYLNIPPYSNQKGVAGVAAKKGAGA
jgi:cell division protein FtsI (penicillin-binding protein 3)